ncbi:MAG: GTP cyclohydrolase II [Gemmatimonadetes bacterium]|nr:MAG: GTP cyclohydrolase II [Gemmatimonadota bacterium]
MTKTDVYAVSNLPTRYGDFKIYIFHNNRDSKEHLAIVNGSVTHKEAVPARIHSECLTGEVFGSLKCDCAAQLEWALKYIAQQACGILLYLRQEGRGIGLGNKIRAYALQEEGLDTIEANHQLGFSDDLREYDIAAAMLKSLKVRSVKLITNNPHKISSLGDYGIPVIERIPVVIEPSEYNREYLKTKMEKAGHLIDPAIFIKSAHIPDNGNPPIPESTT